MTQDRREVIENLTTSLIEGAGLRSEPPIDLNLIAASMGLRVYRVYFEDPNISGLVTFDPKYNAPGTQPGKTATIFVNAADPPTRQNFTVAHEIGHVKLGHVRKEDGFRAERFRAQGQPYDGNEEREANQFAGALLMPAPAFAKALYKQRNMTSVALTFGVSVQAASIRAYELGLITGA